MMGMTWSQWGGLGSADTGVLSDRLRGPCKCFRDSHRLPICAFDGNNFYISQNPLCAFHLQTRHFNLMAAVGINHNLLYLILRYVYKIPLYEQDGFQV